MRLFLDLDYNITSFHAWEFISFSMENISLTIGSALINLNFKNFLFFCNLLSITVLALVFFVYGFSLAIAIIA